MPLIHPCADDIRVVGIEFTGLFEVCGGFCMSTESIERKAEIKVSLGQRRVSLDRRFKMCFRRFPMSQLVLLHPVFVMPSGCRFRMPRLGVEWIAEGATAGRRQQSTTENPALYQTDFHRRIPSQASGSVLDAFTIGHAPGIVNSLPTPFSTSSSWGFAGAWRSRKLLGYLAEGVGFEPTVQLPGHRFSRPARSAAPSPLPVSSYGQCRVGMRARLRFRNPLDVPTVRA